MGMNKFDYVKIGIKVLIIILSIISLSGMMYSINIILKTIAFMVENLDVSTMTTWQQMIFVFVTMYINLKLLEVFYNLWVNAINVSDNNLEKMKFERWKYEVIKEMDKK